MYGSFSNRTLRDCPALDWVTVIAVRTAATNLGDYVASDEGLNAYGAVTWGQFFVYQGFNARLGWMHTTSTADVVDEFAVTPVKCGAGLCYRHGRQLRAFEQVPISLSVRGVPRPVFTPLAA